MTSDAIRAAILLSTPISPGVYDLGDGHELMVGVHGSRLWWHGSQLHREDGPAVEYVNGKQEWWRNGKRVRP